MNYSIFSLTSKHFSNHDVNINQSSSVKSSKFNGFVLALFCILSLGQNLTLENFPLGWFDFSEQTNIFEPKFVLFRESWIFIGRVVGKIKFYDNPGHNILAVLNNFA